jgi:hypothetical protein
MLLTKVYIRIIVIISSYNNSISTKKINTLKSLYSHMSSLVDLQSFYGLNQGS